MSTGKIAGIMVTGKTPARYPLAREAVVAWQLQSYRGDCELLVINDHPTESLYPEKPPKGVTEIRITGQHSLGELRNIGIEEAKARGAAWCVQWDDDDYSHKNRLLYQVSNTQAGTASIFRYEIHCNLKTGEAIMNDGKSIRVKGFPGTMLWPTASDVRFPGVGKAEDTLFLLQLQKERRLQVLINDPTMYCRFYHGHNTWSEQHVMKPKPNSRKLNEAERGYVNWVLEARYRTIREAL